MKAVILAAGIASRLRPLTDHTPKCMLKIGKQTILQRTINNLIRNNLTDIIIVTGYLENQIRKFVDSEFPSLNIQFIFNDVYETTNNIYSLWLTKNFIEGNDILLLDSDILFDHRIIKLLLDSSYKNCVAARIDGNVSDEEIKIKVNDNNSIIEISKEVDTKEAIGESIGIEKFSPDFLKDLFTILDQKILIDNEVNIFYEAAFQQAIDKGAKIFSVDVGSYKCIELDTAEDIKSANEKILKYLE